MEQITDRAIEQNRGTAILLETHVLITMARTSAPSTVREARDRQEVAVGHRLNVLTRERGNVKIGKGKETVSLALGPADESGWQTCPHRSDACEAACLGHSAGRMVFDTARNARTWRTAFLAADPHAFLAVLRHEMVLAAARGVVGVRLNVSSDVRWEVIDVSLIDGSLGLRAYDYTKYPPRARRGYHVTYSFMGGELSRKRAVRYLARGGNVAVVFDTRRGSPLPATWEGYRVIDGDLTDYRPDDAPGTVVGLRAKGNIVGAAGTADGFVQRG